MNAEELYRNTNVWYYTGVEAKQTSFDENIL